MKGAAVVLFLVCAVAVHAGPSADDIDQLLFGMNKARAEKGVAALTWDTTVANYAQAWSDQCALGHNPNLHNVGYGENIAWGTAGWFTPYMANRGWIDNEYSSFQCGNVNSYDHYTQAVWADSTNVGCGITACGGNTFIVCDFQPAGNYYGEQPFPASQCNSVTPCTPSSTCAEKGNANFQDDKCGAITCSGGGSPSTNAPATDAPATDAPAPSPTSDDYAIFNNGLQNGWSDYAASNLNSNDNYNGEAAVSALLGDIGTYNAGGNYLLFMSNGATSNGHITLSFDAAADIDGTLFVFWNGFYAVTFDVSSSWNTHTIPLSAFGNIPSDQALPMLVFWNNGNTATTLRLKNILLTDTPSIGAGGAPGNLTTLPTITAPAKEKSSDASTALLSVVAAAALLLSLF